MSIPDLAGEPLILYLNLTLPGLAQQVMQAFAREGTPLRVEQEVEDMLTAIALVAGGFGACITTASSESLRLPGVAYQPLKCEYLPDIELSCIHRRGDGSPVLAAVLAVVRCRTWGGAELGGLSRTLAITRTERPKSADAAFTAAGIDCADLNPLISPSAWRT